MSGDGKGEKGGMDFCGFAADEADVFPPTDHRQKTRGIYYCLQTAGSFLDFPSFSESIRQRAFVSVGERIDGKKKVFLEDISPLRFVDGNLSFYFLSFQKKCKKSFFFGEGKIQSAIYMMLRRRVH